MGHNYIILSKMYLFSRLKMTINHIYSKINIMQSLKSFLPQKKPNVNTLHIKILKTIIFDKNHRILEY